MINVRAESSIFLVDSEAQERHQFAETLLQHGWRVEVFASPDQFLAANDPQRAGCAILVLRGRDERAFQALSALGSSAPPRPVLVLTDQRDFDLAVECFRAGAAELFLTPPPLDVLLPTLHETALRELAQRKHYRHWSEVSARVARLTPPEMEVVKLLTEGMLNKQIAARLNVAVRTIELRRANIFRKMEVSSLGDLLRLVIFLELYPHGPHGD